MCGGAGTRLWPISRESIPKQFVRLMGARITDADLFARPMVITKDNFRFVIAEQLRERGIAADIVLEPMRRDSGPAVAVGCQLGSWTGHQCLSPGARRRTTSFANLMTFGTPADKRLSL